MESRGTTEEMKRTALERAIIGAMVSRQCMPSLLEIGAAHFLDPFCRRMYALLERMEREGLEIDLVSVCTQDESLDSAAVVEVGQECPVSEVITRQHCAALRDMSIRRTMEAMLRDAQTKRGDVREDIDTLITRLKKLQEVSGAESLGDPLDESILYLLDEFGEEKKEEPPIATGLAKIDSMLGGGVRPGDLAVIAALTGVGKSAMLNFMMRNASEQGKKILFISCEMSKTQNTERFLASISGVPMSQIIRREPLTDDQNVAVSDGLNLYNPQNIRMICSGSMTPALVRRDALRMKTSMGLDMIVVDYLQRLRVDRSSGCKAEDVGSIAAALKSIAVDLNVPVLTAAQFNREAAKARSEFRGEDHLGVPALHQLRDSSQIEDEANCVIVLDEPSRNHDGPRQINAHIVKNRSGMLGVFRLNFDGETMRFYPGQNPVTEL